MLRTGVVFVFCVYLSLTAAKAQSLSLISARAFSRSRISRPGQDGKPRSDGRALFGIFHNNPGSGVYALLISSL